MFFSTGVRAVSHMLDKREMTLGYAAVACRHACTTDEDEVRCGVTLTGISMLVVCCLAQAGQSRCI